ncbi:mechanosensitive ion channel family protein [Sulfuriflexus sp.]|uniref:mechanosensitive ion channel family protein n=1 Tax=Sulfuriflexus sp. TaxID=2015443 RepID=UPI0028CF9BFB|nr:mechanosensitive ion channel domain-containing protein [Sulfuriflexus sp.]MDT8404285.1 mechanosensitive ion channel [Sulfuriflexus sp.]
MPGFEGIVALVRDWLLVALAADIGWQLGVVFLAALAGWLAHRGWQVQIDKRRGKREGLHRLAMRGIGRAALPLIAFLVVLGGRGILSRFEIQTHLLDVLAPLLLSLALIRLLVYILRRAFGPSAALRAWEGVIGSLVWGGVALHLLGWLPDLLAALDAASINLGKTRISMLSILKLIFTIAVLMVVAGWVSRYIEQRAARSVYLSSSMKVGLSKISKVVLYTIATLIALNTVGIDLTTLTIFGGALGVGLGFGLQRIASNFISGFILLFDRSIKPGDVITVGERFGWVVALHARYIVVRDRDGVESLIPNENLITSVVTNWSYTDKHVRVKVPVQISYADDPEEAMQVMLDACQANKRVLVEPPPQARLLSFGDNGIDLELRLWLDDPEQGVGSVRSDINMAVWKGFKEKGITIPFPQRDIHMIDKPT